MNIELIKQAVLEAQRFIDEANKEMDDQKVRVITESGLKYLKIVVSCVVVQAQQQLSAEVWI